MAIWIDSFVNLAVNLRNLVLLKLLKSSLLIILVVASQLSNDVMFYAHPFLWANLVQGAIAYGTWPLKQPTSY
jgi:hypothetical protein